jgi:hypothetical protein
MDICPERRVLRGQPFQTAPAWVIIQVRSDYFADGGHCSARVPGLAQRDRECPTLNVLGPIRRP